MKPRIMYIEDKEGGLAGSGRIGLVESSKTGKTLYYGGRTFASLEGYGYKANYCDVETGEHFWISGPRRDGLDALYPAVVEVDPDVQQEYWTEIRGRPDLAGSTSYWSPGKYSRRRPHPELAVRGRTRDGGGRRSG